MKKDKQHVLVHAVSHVHNAWQSPCCIDIDLKNQHAAWTLKRTAACTCPCCMSMCIMHVHLHAACLRPCYCTCLSPCCMSISMSMPTVAMGTAPISRPFSKCCFMSFSLIFLYSFCIIVFVCLTGVVGMFMSSVCK
jgi:hypothetical protein